MVRNGDMGREFSSGMNDVGPRVCINVESEGIHVSGGNTTGNGDERFVVKFDSVKVFNRN
jgi:hypothetical protein